MDYERFAEQALELMRRNPDIVYGDIRMLLAGGREDLTAKNGVVENAARSEKSGFGIRVLSKKGAWGFASSAGLERSDPALSDELCRTFRRALALSAAGGRGRMSPLLLARDRARTQSPLLRESLP